MKAAIRLVAVLLLTVVLPVQGVAAACAQVCALAQAERHGTVITLAPAQDGTGEASDESHCGDSDVDAGKCCQAHTLMVGEQGSMIRAPEAGHEHDFLVVRWTNFIPEEPSPPPIAAASIA